MNLCLHLRPLLRLLPILAVGLVFSPAGAQPGAQDSEWQARIERAARQAERAAAAPQTPAGLADIPQPPPGAGQGARTDIRDLAEAFRSGQSAGQKAPGGLLAFVSFGMPEAALDRLIDDAQRYRATLVMRGLVEHSFAKTAKAVQARLGKRQVAWIIDPEAFTRFGVTQVPTFVLVRKGASLGTGADAACGTTQCFAQADTVKTVGDVTIDYALDFIERQEPSWRGEIDTLREMDALRARRAGT